MRTRHAVAGAVAILLSCALTLVGCGGGGGVGGSNQPGVKPPDVSASNKESVNESSVQDLTATLRTNQVPDPRTWAQVIMQYRPYPKDDPGMGRLRKVLADHRADPRTVDQIAAVLQP